ncbi:flagellar biosynthesis protein FliQ [Nocardioides panacihumi]|uniref:Flagellar biosynthetic protein FliQ n=1 Tax=Nocardioides panacihumi TaxID=400774 RepID=A0ABP5C4A5_9ACTN
MIPVHLTVHLTGLELTDTAIIGLALKTMLVAFKLSAPILATSLVVGFTISLFQSMTQIQEVTLSFVPKVIGVGIALLICGNWMLHTMVSFTQHLFESIPSLLS